MKQILCLLVIMFSGFVGNKIAKRYIIRSQFFDELYRFCVYIKNNICFNKKTTKEIFDDYLTDESIRFYEQLICLQKVIENQEVLSDKTKMSFLTDDEFKTIVTFFQNLGTLDLERAEENLNIFLKFVEGVKIESENIKQNKAGLSYKLSISIGVIVGIIII